MSDSPLPYGQMSQRDMQGRLYELSQLAGLRIRRFWIGEPDPVYGPFLQCLGKSLRSRREAAGYSQESFADKIGMHRTYYSAIERGEKNLQVDTLHRICAGLKVRMCDVLKDADT